MNTPLPLHGSDPVEQRLVVVDPPRRARPRVPGDGRSLRYGWNGHYKWLEIQDIEDNFEVDPETNIVSYIGFFEMSDG